MSTQMTDEEYAQYQQYRRQVAQRQSMPQQHRQVMPQNESAVIDGKWLDSQQSVFERYIGLLLLSISFVGSAIAFNGGAKMPIFWIGVTGGLALQGVITWVEWLYRRDRIGWKYGVAFIIDTLLSIFGFGPILLAPLSTLLTKARIEHILPTALTIDHLAWSLITILAAILAILPEAILIKD